MNLEREYKCHANKYPLVLVICTLFAQIRQSRVGIRDSASAVVWGASGISPWGYSYFHGTLLLVVNRVKELTKNTEFETLWVRQSPE